MKIGMIRALIKEASVSYSLEKDVQKKQKIENHIATIIRLIKNKLGDFASVADDCVLLDCSNIEQSCLDLKKVLQE